MSYYFNAYYYCHYFSLPHDYVIRRRAVDAADIISLMPLCPCRIISPCQMPLICRDAMSLMLRRVDASRYCCYSVFRCHILSPLILRRQRDMLATPLDTMMSRHAGFTMLGYG